MIILNKPWVLGSVKWNLVDDSYVVSDLFLRDVATRLSVLSVMILEWKKLKRNKVRFISLKYL
jgi:hypothetical protein